ncbi:hypothetical protein Pmani_012369 [Petrolisthes manimaculis]|uniref:Uncharacterized protein n=1 Tax=Petrolisthes manimaculis TaxID=1843537 RepID=A0AAE1Q0W9_9EUCA|nr:hypothetical protein Pmani_012369 [Petrolisthes manimaculis]
MWSVWAFVCLVWAGAGVRGTRGEEVDGNENNTDHRDKHLQTELRIQQDLQIELDRLLYEYEKYYPDDAGEETNDEEGDRRGTKTTATTTTTRPSRPRRMAPPNLYIRQKAPKRCMGTGSASVFSGDRGGDSGGGILEMGRGLLEMGKPSIIKLNENRSRIFKGTFLTRVNTGIVVNDASVEGLEDTTRREDLLEDQGQTNDEISHDNNEHDNSKLLANEREKNITLYPLETIDDEYITQATQDFPFDTPVPTEPSFIHVTNSEVLVDSTHSSPEYEDPTRYLSSSVDVRLQDVSTISTTIEEEQESSQEGSENGQAENAGLPELEPRSHTGFLDRRGEFLSSGGSESVEATERLLDREMVLERDSSCTFSDCIQDRNSLLTEGVPGGGIITPLVEALIGSPSVSIFQNPSDSYFFMSSDTLQDLWKNHINANDTVPLDIVESDASQLIKYYHPLPQHTYLQQLARDNTDFQEMLTVSNVDRTSSYPGLDLKVNPLLIPYINPSIGYLHPLPSLSLADPGLSYMESAPTIQQPNYNVPPSVNSDTPLTPDSLPFPIYSLVDLDSDQWPPELSRQDPATDQTFFLTSGDPDYITDIGEIDYHNDQTIMNPQTGGGNIRFPTETLDNSPGVGNVGMVSTDMKAMKIPVEQFQESQTITQTPENIRMVLRIRPHQGSSVGQPSQINGDGSVKTIRVMINKKPDKSENSQSPALDPAMNLMPLLHGHNFPMLNLHSPNLQNNRPVPPNSQSRPVIATQDLPTLSVSPQGLNPQLQTPQNTNPQLQIPQNTNPQLQIPQNTNPQLQIPQNTNPQLQIPQNTNPQLQIPQNANPQLVFPQNSQPAGGVAPQTPGGQPKPPRSPQLPRPNYSNLPVLVFPVQQPKPATDRESNRHNKRNPGTNTGNFASTNLPGNTRIPVIGNPGSSTHSGSNGSPLNGNVGNSGTSSYSGNTRTQGNGNTRTQGNSNTRTRGNGNTRNTGSSTYSGNTGNTGSSTYSGNTKIQGNGNTRNAGSSTYSGNTGYTGSSTYSGNTRIRGNGNTGNAGSSTYSGNTKIRGNGNTGNAGSSTYSGNTRIRGNGNTGNAGSSTYSGNNKRPVNMAGHGKGGNFGSSSYSGNTGSSGNTGNGGSSGNTAGYGDSGSSSYGTVPSSGGQGNRGKGGGQYMGGNKGKGNNKNKGGFGGLPNLFNKGALDSLKGQLGKGMASLGNIFPKGGIGGIRSQMGKGLRDFIKQTGVEDFRNQLNEEGLGTMLTKNMYKINNNWNKLVGPMQNNMETSFDYSVDFLDNMFTDMLPSDYYSKIMSVLAIIAFIAFLHVRISLMIGSLTNSSVTIGLLKRTEGFMDSLKKNDQFLALYELATDVHRSIERWRLGDTDMGDDLVAKEPIMDALSQVIGLDQENFPYGIDGFLRKTLYTGVTDDSDPEANVDEGENDEDGVFLPTVPPKRTPHLPPSETSSFSPVSRISDSWSPSQSDPSIDSLASSLLSHSSLPVSSSSTSSAHFNSSSTSSSSSPFLSSSSSTTNNSILLTELENFARLTSVFVDLVLANGTQINAHTRGTCLQRPVCDLNAYSDKLGGLSAFLFPIISTGVTWMIRPPDDAFTLLETLRPLWLSGSLAPDHTCSLVHTCQDI